MAQTAPGEYVSTVLLLFLWSRSQRVNELEQKKGPSYCAASALSVSQAVNTYAERTHDSPGAGYTAELAVYALPPLM